MLNQIKGWQGPVNINDTDFSSFPSDLSTFNGEVHIKLYPKGQKSLKSQDMKMKQSNSMNCSDNSNNSEIKITVKAYMTRKSTPEFDFMAHWNNDNPMPLRTMVGTIEKETPGMYYMKLHGKGVEEIRCMRCGRELTNPVSRHYGIGPECMAKLGIVANIEDIEAIKEKLVNVTWEGYVIKSAIIEKENI